MTNLEGFHVLLEDH